jgi:hypothetical protein
MNKFVFKTFLFLIPVLLILISGIFLPPTPNASKSFLFAAIKKDSLLKYTLGPRIIFIGGSNLGFGLNSRMIKDSLSLNPINTGIGAGMGLKYMLENTLQYIKENDLIIIAPEYVHYFKDYEIVSEDLFRTVFDVSPDKLKLLSFKQKKNILQYLPKFSFSKFKPSEYWGYQESDVYSINSFNKYGDVDAHWQLKNRDFAAANIKDDLNPEVFEKLKYFEQLVIRKGAKVYLTFSCYEESSFKNSKANILKIEEKIKNQKFNVLGSAQRYTFPKKMMFNSVYHLNKKGVDFRTKLFVEDFKKAQKDKL